ncbi:MAG: hypothetical protein V3W41_14205 [Planctomycetota bacterium]
MNQRRDFERLLEAYVLGDAADHERRLVEGVLAGGEGEVRAAEAREALKFEQSLHVAFDASLELQSSGEQGEASAAAGSLGVDSKALADQVLARVYRRPASRDRRCFENSVAQNTLNQLRRSSQIRETKSRSRYYFQRPGFLRVAVLMILFTSMAFFGLRDYRREQNKEVFNSGPNQMAAALGDVAYVSSSNLSGSIPKGSKARSRLVIPSEITTRSDQVAIVRLSKRGRLMIKPQSRVRLLRSKTTGAIIVQIERGGIRAQMQRENQLRIIAVNGRDGYVRGVVTGDSEIVRASDALGKNRSLVAPVFDRTFLITVRKGGSAVFRNADDELRLVDGDLGVVGDATLVKLPHRSVLSTEVPSRSWTFDEVVENAGETALSIGPEATFSRAFLAREAMRVYGADLVEAITKSHVISAELKRRNLQIPRANDRIAMAFVTSNELMQVTPMRSRFAIDERAYQVAGLLTLAAGGSAVSRNQGFAKQLGQICDRTWNALQAGVQIRWADKISVDRALDISYRGRVFRVGLKDAWETLRRSLREAEMDRVIDDFIERHLIEKWLRSQGESWPALSWTPDPDPVRRSAQKILVRMTGLTLRQYIDRLAVQRAILAFIPEPEEADVSRFLVEKLPDRTQVFFQHFVYPFGSGDQGIVDSLDQGPRELAYKAAQAATDQMREGLMPTPVTAETQHPSLWRTRWGIGPRPWWDEVYGSSFRPAVLALDDNEVSAPIEGREGYHVIRMRRTKRSVAVSTQLRAAARNLVKVDQVRRDIEKLLKEVEMKREPAADLLR